MKKGIKAAVITALVCIAAGGVLMGAGVAAGGRKQLKEEDLFSLADINVKLVSEGSYSGEEEAKGVEVLDGDFDYNVAYSGELRALEIKIGVHGLKIEEGTGKDIRIEGKNCDKIQCYVKEGTLYVKDVGKNKKFMRINDRELVLTVPEGICWEEADIDADLGYVIIGTLDTRTAQLDAEMGSIEIERLTADKTDIEAEKGNIQIGFAQIGKLDVSADMGNVEIIGSVEGNVKAQANMGSIELILDQEEDDFNYEFTAEMGSVVLNGVEYSGVSRKKKIENGAEWKMELDSSMGSIDICFE